MCHKWLAYCDTHWSEGQVSESSKVNYYHDLSDRGGTDMIHVDHVYVFLPRDRCDNYKLCDYV